jgi:predicted TIM-barrel fold metal-dependent hydrolase
MPHRQLSFPISDADNHLYETRDSFTKHLPKRYRGLVEYVTVNGRTKIAIGGQISNYIPNPTFEVVARPGAQEEYFKLGNKEGRSRREIMGESMQSIPAFFEPAARLELLDEQGIERALIWPTLASLIEERLREDPVATHVVTHSLNEWLHETWSFNYESRMFPAPVISLNMLDRALTELDWVLERGAKVILVRPAPVPGPFGTRSFALPEFDPFWERVQEADILVGLHGSDSGYSRHYNEWEGSGNEFLPFGDPSGFQAVMHHLSRPIYDAIASAIGHGMLSRFPRIKLAAVENGAGWVPRLLEDLTFAYNTTPQSFAENPVDVFKRNVYIHPFHEEDPRRLIELIGHTHVLFGSDFPHPEGLADPVSFIDEISDLPEHQVAEIMGGNLTRLLGLAA